MTDAGHMSGGAPILPGDDVPSPTRMARPYEAAPPMDAEKRLTRDEWLREQALEQCGTEGHIYNHITVWGGNEPIALLCPVCGKKWTVTPA